MITKVNTIFSALLLLLFVVSLDSASLQGRNGKVVVCYVGTWAVYREGKGAFSVDDINPELCTHLVYSFAGLDTSNWTIKSLDRYNDLEEEYGKGNFKKMTALKRAHPHLKVTLAIGGWNEGSANYSKLAADPGRRATFTSSVLEYLKTYNFDGLDLDWEFPTKRGGKPEDKENFILLVQELGNALKRQGYILTAAISAAIETLESGYDLHEVQKHLDLVHLMCYDYHGSWDKKTGPNAPLTPASDPLTIESSVKYVLAHGVPKEKLVVGIPLYGRTFVLDGTNETSGNLGDPTKENEGFQGPFTKTNGFLGFNEVLDELILWDSSSILEQIPPLRVEESLAQHQMGYLYDTFIFFFKICNELRSPQWKGHWDDLSNTPWASSGNKIIVYDNARSIKLKVNYAMEMGLAGVLTWSMDTDDFRGDCSFPGDPEPKYPLLRAINEAIAQSFVKPPPNQKGFATHLSPFSFVLLSLASIITVISH